ncbi:MAG: FliH/SctL family protein [Bryobacteraceae bacterium]|jgi:flagellar assembly protein FliH
MSSKIVLADASPAASPVVWRQVQPGGPAGGGEAAGQLAQIERQIEERVREARAAGLREGEAAARNRAAAELQRTLDRVAQSIQELAGWRARLRREAEADLVRLALEIARRVVRREIAVDPDALRGLVTAALEKLQGQDISRVKVHPSHAALLAACLKQGPGGSTVEVVADSSREPGTVIFETARGNLDASVDAQLQEIERGLVDRLRKQP